jgi:Ulp1 family protease
VTALRRYFKCHYFNSFFLELLTRKGNGCVIVVGTMWLWFILRTRYDYERVKKWTRTFDLFALDKVETLL